MSVTREYTFSLPLDVEKIMGITEEIEFVVGDKNRCILNISITQDEQAVDITGNDVQVNIKKPDGTVVIQDSVNSPSTVQVVYAAAGLIKVILEDQSLTGVGTNVCDIVLINGDDRATTQEFSYYVRSNKDGQGALQSTSVISYLNQLLAAYEAATNENTVVELTDARLEPITGITHTNIGDRMDFHSSRLSDIAVNGLAFGCVGDGVANDIDAIEATIAYALSHGYKKVIFPKIHAIGRPLYLDNLPAGFSIEFEELKKATTFTGTDLIICGSASSGVQRNIHVYVNYLNGVNRAVNGVRNRGFSYTTFFLKYVKYCNNVYIVEGGGLQPIADTCIKGHLIDQCNRGFHIDAAGGMHAENTRIEYNFIANCVYGGIYFKANCGYQYVNAALDFNGQLLTELEVSTNHTMVTGDFVDGLTSGATNAEVIATYGRNSKKYILVKNVASDFVVGETIENQDTETTTVITVRKGNTEGNYFDIINEKKESSFSRNTYICSYVDNIVGEYINTDKMFIANTTSNTGTKLNGTGFSYDPVNKWGDIIDLQSGSVVMRTDANGVTWFHPIETTKTTVFSGNVSLRGNTDIHKDLTVYDTDFNILGSASTTNIGIGKVGGGNTPLLTLNVDKTTFNGLAKLKRYAKASLPTASTSTDCIIMVSDDIGGLTIAYCDGTNWRRVADSAIVS